MTPAENKDRKILIVGAGVFGLSTAFHLAKSGYSNITVLDRGETIPSKYSAGNDLNKIMRVEYEDDFYTDLALVSDQTIIRVVLSANVLGRHRGTLGCLPFLPLITESMGTW